MSIQFSQPSTSRGRLKDKEQPFKHHTQPWLDPSPQQASFASLRSLYLDARALVIEFEVLLIDSHQVVFEGSFENNNKVKSMTQLSDDIGHHLTFKVCLVTWIANGRQVTLLQCFAKF